MKWLEQFGHGGDLVTAAERFGITAAEWLDYSANINPLGPPERVMNALYHGMQSIVHYPDPAHRLFRQVLADRLSVPADWILPGNGAAECMALAILALSPHKVGVIYPCFSEYEALSKQFGAEVLACRSEESTNYKPELKSLYPLFQQTDLVFVGHPNNPTGILWDKDELEKLAEWTEETETFLIVDEAFLDFIPSDQQLSLITDLQHFPRVILIRSMTKFYAIPGLRLGYTIAEPSLIRRMREKQVTWSVNVLALLAGELCLAEIEYEEKTRELIQRERAYLMESIRTQLGWQVWPGQANFLLVRCPEGKTARELQEALAVKGILIRNCSMYPGLTPRDFRIAVRTREQNNRLLEACKQIAANWGDLR